MIRYYFSLLIFCFSTTLNISASDPETWAQGYYEALFINSVPVIDGIGDESCWDSAVWRPIDQRWIGPSYTAEDYSGRFKALWTASRVYVLIEVVDDSLRLQDPGLVNVCSNIYNYDCVEIFIDENHSRDVNYANSHKAFAYHMDTLGSVCYANGSFGWERLDDHIFYKMKRVSGDTFHYEYEIKIFDDTFVYGVESTPVTLTEGKLMGWSIAYNDNDMGTIRQNMIGSKFVPGDSDYERNVSYYNASVFGDLKLVMEYGTVSSVNDITDPFHCDIRNTGDELVVTFQNMEQENLQIQLFDSSGRECRKSIAGISTGYSEQHLDIAGLPRGLYILTVTGANSRYDHKIIL
ncbi:MAG: T9SS type A sorting domain-containing protein [Bacteroidales bacterium]|nr:T9SS type A sorting domain-containing protein [Bacteroidales bacterium]